MKTLEIFLNLIFISIVIFNSSCSFEPKIISGEDGELTTQNITQNRNMSQYEQGGHLRCCRWSPPGDRTNISVDEKIVRDFIWNHWTEKKRGYIRLTYMGTDNSWTTHYFIKPDEKGEWIVSWEWLYNHSLPEYNQPRKKGFGTVRQVDSVRRKGDWELIFEPIEGDGINIIPIL